MREFSAEPVAIQYISSAHLAVVVEIPSTRAEIISLQNSPSLPEPRLQTEMRAKKVVVGAKQGLVHVTLVRSVSFREGWTTTP